MSPLSSSSSPSNVRSNKKANKGPKKDKTAQGSAATAVDVVLPTNGTAAAAAAEDKQPSSPVPITTTASSQWTARKDWSNESDYSREKAIAAPAAEKPATPTEIAATPSKKTTDTSI